MGLDTKVTTEESYEAGFTEISYPRVKNCAETYEQLLKTHNGQQENILSDVRVPDVVASENCFGSELFACKNAVFCFGANDAEDCKYCFEQF